jgi:hypothetical protein
MTFDEFSPIAFHGKGLGGFFLSEGNAIAGRELFWVLVRNVRVGLILFLPRRELKYLYDIPIQIEATKYFST